MGVGVRVGVQVKWKFKYMYKKGGVLFHQEIDHVC